MWMASMGSEPCMHGLYCLVCLSRLWTGSTSGGKLRWIFNTAVASGRAGG